MSKKIIVLVSSLIVLGCLFNFNPSPAGAMTTDEILALIQKLQQQIADLQKQLTQNTQAVWCHDFNKNLSAGSNGEEVASLHTVLEKEGFDVFDEEKANKDFGESTASAISGFQQKYADEILKPLGLKYSTGIAGKSTRTKLNALFGCGQKAEPKPFCQQTAVLCDSSAKIICPAGLDDKGCPFPCKCTPVACTMDVKACPDGSYAKRVPPSCEFTACPDQTTNQPPTIYGASGPTYLKINESGSWTIKASDPEKGGLSYSVCWGGSEFCQAAPTALKSTEQNFTQSSSFTHTYDKTGIYTIAFTVTDSQGLTARTTLNVKVEESSYPTISEQVKCVFKGSQTDQKCYGASSNYANYSCADKETCVVDVKGVKGERITWKSTCGGYAYTTMDGQNEYAEFSCGTASASLNVISPNGREAWELGKAFEIKWKQTQNANVSVTVRNKQLPGTGNDLWFNMVVNGSVAGFAGENRTWWDIPDYLNAHTGYEICLAGSFTNGTSQTIALEDCSDSPFAIHGAVVSTTGRTCAEMSASQQYYFDTCQKGGFDNVCFNRFSGVYQGCTRNIRNDCTEQNANAQVNMLCPITTAVIAVPVPMLPTPTTSVTQPTATPTETGVGVYRFEVLDSQASCSCPQGTDCSSSCKPASTYAIYTAKVSVYDEKGKFIASKDTGSGMAVFDNLPYGNYVAYFSAAGYQEDKISFSVGPNFPTNNTSILKKVAAQTTTQTTNKSITLMSPNGGETLLKGSTYAIKWNASGVDSVYIKLRKGADIKTADTYNGPEGEVSKTISNSGIFFWTVPKTLPDGNDYAIRVIDSSMVVLDDSDSLFSVTTSPVAVPIPATPAGASTP